MRFPLLNETAALQKRRDILLLPTPREKFQREKVWDFFFATRLGLAVVAPKGHNYQPL